MEAPDVELETKRALDMVYSARTGDLEGVRFLLEDGVPLGFRDNSGWTALKWSASEGHEAVVTLLLENNAVNHELEGSAADGAEPSGGGSPLHW